MFWSLFFGGDVYEKSPREIEIEKLLAKCDNYARKKDLTYRERTDWKNTIELLKQLTK